MADVINLGEFKEKKSGRLELESGDLNKLMKRALLICKEKIPFSEDKPGLVKTEQGQLKGIFERRITQEIFTRKLVGSDVFLCGIYISNLLADLVLTSSDSWWAIDYADSDDPADFKKGGDTCFLICGVFPERRSARAMSLPYYQEMGIGFYHRFYTAGRKEIGYHMSRQFETMAEIVQDCFRNF